MEGTTRGKSKNQVRAAGTGNHNRIQSGDAHTTQLRMLTKPLPLAIITYLPIRCPDLNFGLMETVWIVIIHAADSFPMELL